MPTTPVLDIHFIQEQLRLKGAVVLDLDKGKKLYIVLSCNLGLDEKGILVTGDGGTLYWTLDRPVNPFRLISSGFNMKIAEPLSNLINAILSVPAKPTLSKDPSRLAISAAPKG